MMENFESKLIQYATLRYDIDGHIWSIFDRYVKDMKINFSQPDNWIYEMGDDGIKFYGTDGCMGCYDTMSITIPICYFTNYDESVSEHFESIRREKEEKRIMEEKIKENRKLEKEQRDYNTYLKLKNKFESGDGNEKL